MAATLKIPTIFTAVDKISGIVKNMGKNVQGFANKMQSGISAGNRLFRKLTPSIGEAGKQLLSFASTAAIAASIVSGAHFGVQSIMDYETALHSLEAVTGESSAKFKFQIEDIANRTHKSAIDVAGSFEVIGSAMSQYLSDPKALGQITEAGITLAKASRQELTPTLENLTSVMNQFKIEAKDANDTIQKLTAGEIVGSVSTSKIAVALQEFGANAYASNVNLGESVALLETLGKQMDHSKIAIGARNLLSVMSSAKGLSKPALYSLQQHNVNLDLLMDKTKPLGARLKELSKVQGDAIAITNIFQKENMTAANVIFSNLKTYDEYEKKIQKTKEAEKQAAINSDTLANAIAEIKNSFINAIVTGDKTSSTLDKVKTVAFWVANNMTDIVTVGAKVLIFFAAWKAILLASSIIMGAYNIALGIQRALSGAASIAIGQNTIALAAYNVTTKIVTAAQWLWSGAMGAATAAQRLLNAAMTANPIGLIIVGIAALIALIAVIIAKWDSWGAALSLFLGPIGLVISMIQSFRRNWDMVVAAFKTDGILGGLKAVGRVLLDAILMPVQQLLELLSKIPGLGDLAGAGAKKILEIRQSLGVDTGDGGKTKPTLESPEVAQSRATSESIQTQRNTIDMNVTTGPGTSTTTKSKGPLNIPIKTTPTNGAR